MKNKRKRLSLIKTELLPNAQHEAKKCQRVVADLKREQEKLVLELTPKPSKEPNVSDHALVRYLERVHGFDLDKFRDEILTPERASAIRSGCKEINCGNVKFRVAGNTVITSI